MEVELVDEHVPLGHLGVLDDAHDRFVALQGYDVDVLHLGPGLHGRAGSSRPRRSRRCRDWCR